MIKKIINNAREILINMNDDEISKLLASNRLTGTHHRLTDCVIAMRDEINEKLNKK